MLFSLTRCSDWHTAAGMREYTVAVFDDEFRELFSFHYDSFYSTLDVEDDDFEMFVETLPELFLWAERETWHEKFRENFKSALLRSL
jgi:hypothetical protein